MKKWVKSLFGFLAIFLSLSILIQPKVGTALVSLGYTTEKTCFTLAYHDEISNYNITPLFALPGEKVSLKIESEDEKFTFAFDGGSGSFVQSGAQQWTWVAPQKPGLYPFKIVENTSGESMLVNAFVMVPYAKAKTERINGYKIGNYPPVPSSKSDFYPLPKGFIEVTPANKNTYITPHFTLGQFLCKQEGSYPKYVVLRERLLTKLELLLEHVNAEGIACETFSVMSGYRTPHYNRILRNVRYSRHMWGDAADIYISSKPGQNTMDDLNGDGKRDIKDADFLAKIVDEVSNRPAFKRYIGGLGSYKPTSSHGPFIHVDSRGFETSWRS